jgi:hypothetical protein
MENTTEEPASSDASQGADNAPNVAKKLEEKTEVVVPKAPHPNHPNARRALLGANKKRKAMEKSTTTTTTPTINTPVNVYDAVLGEAEDLLQAAAEAQALGRLKMASAYQLLLHARLVGLAKRFDRAQVLQGATESSEAATDGSPSSTVETTESPTATAAAVESSSPSSPAIHNHLASMLPQNVEMDSAMMEHLARAAMELHHQRTGRRIASDNITEPPPVPPKSNATSIVWTEQERQQVQAALKAGTKEASKIASSLKTGKSEAQVRAYLRNLEERQKGSAQIEEEFTSNNADFVSPRRRGGRGRKPPTKAMNTVPNASLDAKSLLAGKGL